MLYELLKMERSQSQQKEWYLKKESNTYIDLPRSKLQVHFEGINDDVFLFGVHTYDDEPLDVKPDFYKVRVIGEGISDSQDLGNFFRPLTRVAFHGNIARCA
jgi:hypothetical protein